MSDERRPDVPGVDADKPMEVPAAGWWQVIRRAWAEAKADQVPLLAAGVGRKLLALGMTLGAIVFVLLAVSLFAAGAAIGNDVPTPVRILLDVARLVLAVVLIMVALAVTYRLGPDRDAPRIRWVSTGAVVGTVIWLIASIGFSIYVETFGNYAKTYGSLAAVVVLMLWLWLTAYAVLLGAEINAEAEQQTARDTTKGEPRPLGERDAVKADSLPQ